jgi:hypothetical protein
MNEKIYRAQIQHIRRCIEALRLLDLAEIAACAEEHGTQADRDLIAALLLALETLPNDSH